MVSAPEQRRPLASMLAQRLPRDVPELLRSRRPVPETRRSYGADVGGLAPLYLGTEQRAELKALEQLRREGLVVVEAPEALGMRELLRMPRQVRELPTKEVCGTLGCQVCQEPSIGRRHFLVRGTEAAEHLDCL